MCSARGGGGGGETRYIKKVGMLVENFEIDPKGDQSGRGARIFWPLIETNLGEFLKKKCCIFSRATLSETLKAKNIGNFFLNTLSETKIWNLHP